MIHAFVCDPAVWQPMILYYEFSDGRGLRRRVMLVSSVFLVVENFWKRTRRFCEASSMAGRELGQIQCAG